jgi:ribulose kinase
LTESQVEAKLVKGIGFAATCSLAVFDKETEQPVSVSTTPKEEGSDPCNVILWLDHRAGPETREINATHHKLLKYVGGAMSPEMEMPKVLWLKHNMPADIFSRCKFYDLTDALEHLATGNEKRSYCSVTCKQGYVPVGVDDSTTGWQPDFLKDIGLEILTEDGYERLGGVDGVVRLPFPLPCPNRHTHCV